MRTTLEFITTVGIVVAKVTVELHGFFTLEMHWLCTLQLVRLMRESHGPHACGLKTSILRIKDNFSRLTNKSRLTVI